MSVSHSTAAPTTRSADRPAACLVPASKTVGIGFNPIARFRETRGDGNHLYININISIKSYVIQWRWTLFEIHAFRLSRAFGKAPVRSTPMPRGPDTVPAGASFGSLPIVDSTAGCRCIHAASCAQPGRTNARIAIARLIFISLTSDAGAGMPIIRIVLMSRHSSAAT
jgi:hypothetical protein